MPSKMKEVYQKNELAFDILKGILITGGVLTCLVLPGMAVVLKMFLPKDKKQQYKIERSYKGLIKNKYIEVEELKEGPILRITDRGKEYLMRADFDKLVLTGEKNWDKKWRVVMFDVPEIHHHARRQFSYKLFELGMYQYQKSVYVYPYDCTDVINFAAEFLGIQDSIRQMTLLTLDKTTELKKFYKLR